MSNLTKEYLQEVLHYAPDTGLFTWKVSKGTMMAGSAAGSPSADGYIRIKINKKFHRAHRLAWFCVHGIWPEELIDHINGVRSDNRIANLRKATRTDNNRNRKMQKNNTSGVKGVTWNKQGNKWAANCKVNGKQHHVGYFTSIAKADQAVKKFREKNHGEFANHGSCDLDTIAPHNVRVLK